MQGSNINQQGQGGNQAKPSPTLGGGSLPAAQAGLLSQLSSTIQVSDLWDIYITKIIVGVGCVCVCV